MRRKEKKSFASSKKFAELEKDAKQKQRDRSIQKRTGYERDMRVMMLRVMEPVRKAEEGEIEITYDELRMIRLRVDKLITKSRVLESSKGVNLSTIRMKVSNEKQMIMDYIQGKRELPGLVHEKGKGGAKSPTQETASNGNTQSAASPVKDEVVDVRFNNLGFGDNKSSNELVSRDSYYKSLGFDDVEEKPKREEEEGIIASPVTKPTAPQQEAIIVEKSAEQHIVMTEGFTKMTLNLVDSKISHVINTGIEHLMHYRRDRKPDSKSYRAEIVRYISDEIVIQKNKTSNELRVKGYSDAQVNEFRKLFIREYEINKNMMIRKCLYMSRVLEYRKGSTASG